MIYLCAMMYFVSYVTRIDYMAVMVEIINKEGITKSLASMAITGSAVTYGIGQIVSGYMGDRLSPRKIIACGLLGAAVMNILLPLCKSAVSMTVIWSINGFAQAMLWPPLVRIMTEAFDDDTYKRACVRVSWGSAYATIAVYLLAPLVIHAFGWKLVFVFASVIGAFMCVLWFFGSRVLLGKIKETSAVTEKQLVGAEENKKEPFTKPVLMILGVIMLTIVLQGSLRDGIAAWMPTYISDVFGLGSEVSILTGVILPIFSIVCFQLASILNRKFIRNELLCNGVMFAAGFAAAITLTFSSAGNVVLSVIMFAILTGLMHGINLIQTCMIPPHFVKYGKVSLISGSLNASTYIGSALSTYITAIIAEKSGWNVTTIIWAATALAGCLISIAAAKAWRHTDRRII